MTKAEALNWLVFAIAVLWFVSFRFVGDVYVSELALILSFLFMFQKHGRKLNAPVPKRILLFGLLWFLSQVVTDVVRAVPFEDFLRGWAAILFFLIDFAALYMLLHNNEKRLKLFVWGVVIGGVLKPLISPSEFYDAEPWKFGFGMPIILLTILLITWASKKRYFLPVLGEFSLVIIGLVSIYLNARSLGAALILTALLLFVSRQKLIYGLFLRRLSFLKLIVISSLATMMLVTTLLTYQWVGESGLLPEKGQVKFESSQSSSLGLIGTLLSGRIEIIGSAHAVIDSPILGHGSWAKNPKYRYFLYDANTVLGVDRSEESLDRFIEKTDLIPAHSHLMQAWVWAGLLGAIFWFMILGLVLKGLLQTLRYVDVFTTLTVFICVSSAWALLFSPFSSSVRFTWGWQLVLIIMAYTKVQGIGSDRKEAGHAKTEMESHSV